MSLAYIPPGVTVQELTSPSVAPLLAIPGSICLVGLSAGVITRTDILTLDGTTAVQLYGAPRDQNGVLKASFAANVATTVNGASQTISTTASTLTVASTTGFPTVGTISVAGVANPVAYTGTTSTTFTGCTVQAGSSTATNSGSVVHTAAVASVMDATTPSIAPFGYSASADFTFDATNGTIVRKGSGVIPDGNQVYVTYSYTPLDYFQPIRLTSMADIQTRFGDAWTADRNAINSPLSFAAGMAFQNGASNLVLQPLYYKNPSDGTRSQPSAVQAALDTVWATAFDGLLDLEDINIIVPVVGQSQTGVTDSVMAQIEQDTQSFIKTMKDSADRWLIAVLGEDSSASASVAQDATLQAHAQTLIPRYNADVTEQLVFVNTSKHRVASPTNNLSVGGQYMAAAIAGMLASRDPAATLTRQAVAGFLSVEDTRLASEKIADAASGMLVVENKGSLVQVRHSITMDNTNSATRELNVVRAKHYIIESVRNTLDTQIVGKIVADTAAPTIVNNVVIGTLEDLRRLGALLAYRDVQSRITTLDPTTMEVRFSYAPAFVINYINVAFTLDLTSQSILVSSANTTT